MKRSLLIFGIIFCVCSSFTDERIFSTLTMQDGLGDNTVMSIHKDRYGFMWFGTTTGLSRYDGNSFRNFTAGNSNLNVSEIREATVQCFAIISNGGIHFFNHISNKFIHSELPSSVRSNGISNLYTSVNNHIWAISGNRLLLFGITENKDEDDCVQSVRLRLMRSAAFHLGKNDELSQFCYSPTGKCFYLLSSHGCLFKYSIGSRRQKQMTFLKTKYTSILASSMILTDGFLWISTIGKGIFRYHLSTGTVDEISKGALSHDDVYKIIPMNNHHYLAVTWSGYTVINLNKNDLKQYTTEIVENPTSAMQDIENRMITGYYDSGLRMLWIGTRGGGISFLDLRQQYYYVVRQMQHNEIGSIISDNHRYLWLATYHRGIMKSKTPYQYGKHLEFDEVGPSSENKDRTTLCAMKGRDGVLWFGNKNGSLVSYDERRQTFTLRHPLLSNGTINTSSVWSLFQDSRLRIWIGTDNALFLYDKSDNSLRLMKGNTSIVRCITETRNGTVWVGTDNGLLSFNVSPDGKMNMKRGYEKSISSLNGLNIRSLLASSDGRLYVGYAGGLAIIKPELNKIVSFFTTDDGMSSNFVGCLANDDNGRVWIGNVSAISRFSRHQHIFYNYYISRNNCSVMYLDNTLFFGNNRNLTYIYPEEMALYQHKKYDVKFTSLKIANRLVEVGEKVNGQAVLQKDLSASSKVVLSNRNRDFSISFNNLCYSKDMQQYNYRLYPYQKKWLVLNEKNEVSYTNLPQGEYSFEVCCIYPDGTTGEVTEIKIIIKPHWSRTPLFRFFVFLLLIGVLFYIIRYVNLRRNRLVNELKMKNELLKLNMERDKERQMRKEREYFFTSVAHELRTSLTLILSPLMELLNQTQHNPSIHSQLERMYKNGDSLQKTINRLLYVRKIESGMVKLHLSEFNVIPMINNIVESFNTLAVSRHYTLTTSFSVPSLSLWTDAEMFTSALKNLLSNAFKYTPAGGTISVKLDKQTIDDHEFCVLSVSDTGIGMTEKEQQHIFDSFSTGVTDPNYSTKLGIGLFIVRNTLELHHGFVKVESEQGKGSTFRLYFPMGKDQFANDTEENVSYDFKTLNMPVNDKIDEVETTSSVDETDSASKKPKLLIVEDNDEMRHFIASLFNADYNILEAENGQKGIEMTTEHQPVLVITDIMMPILNGFDFVRAIHGRPETAHIPILMLTAKTEDSDELKGLSLGVDDYMMKPFNPQVLKVKVKGLIEQRKRLKYIYTKSLMLKPSEQSKPAMDVFMQQVIYRIEEHLSDVDFNVKMLAEQMNMSQPTLFRQLKQHTDLSAVEIIRSVRVSKAASLLMEKHYSIQEISEMVGFNDVRTLRKHFVKKFGVTPSGFIGE